MADLVEVPYDRVPESSLYALLEEFASRDGTDYGEQETPLATRVQQLHRGLVDGSVVLMFDAASETWDLLAAQTARDLLNNDPNAAADSAGEPMRD